ncbi:MAG: hypothetical protein IPM91_08675 [Bacteroidetes bacterium]|nr:hypothetical protein [Bacteroidota bacterium]
MQHCDAAENKFAGYTECNGGTITSSGATLTFSPNAFVTRKYYSGLVTVTAKTFTGERSEFWDIDSRW